MWPFNKKFRVGVTVGAGALPDPKDKRDFDYDEVAAGSAPVDWNKGYDIEKELDIAIPIKNQGVSSSCVGQGWAYQVAVLDTAETGFYNEVSAKGFYSQIFLPSGGAYIREGAKLAVNFGALVELLVSSYENGRAPSEAFIRDRGWLNDNMTALAKKLQAKEYRTASNSMDIIAAAIRDNFGAVGGVNGQNNGTWGSFEPKPPTKVEWAHCIYFGKFGLDNLGKFIATPNSWGTRGKDSLHPDGWQKLREDYFTSSHMFNPWTLVDKPNIVMSPETKMILDKNEKKLIIEGEGVGRKGVIINGVLRQIIDKDNNRAAAACLYTFANNGYGLTVPTKIFNEMLKGENF